MTADHDDHRSLTPPADPGRPGVVRSPAEARLHAALDAVATDGPVPDAWTAIRDRATTDATPMGPLVAARPMGDGRTALPRRWLAAAAVLLLVAGVAVVAVVGRDGGDPADLTTDLGDPTGFVVPEGLPDGWTVDVVRLERTTTTCPCWQRLWTSDDGRTTVAAGSIGPNRNLSPSEAVDLGGGIQARLRGGTDRSSLAWDGADGQEVSIDAAGLDRGQLIAVARKVLADPRTTAPPVPGVELRATTSQPTAEPSQAPYVTVELTTPAGHRLRYSLTPPGTFGFSIGRRVRDRDLAAGQPPYLEVTGFDDETVVLHDGLWPGVDITGPVQVGQPGPGPTAEEVDTLLASLRPASAERWQAFVTDATEGAPAAIAPTLRSLAAPTGPDGAPTATTSPATPSTTTTTTGATDPTPSTGWYVPQGLPDGWSLTGAQRGGEGHGEYVFLQFRSPRTEELSVALSTPDPVTSRAAWVPYPLPGVAFPISEDTGEPLQRGTDLALVGEWPGARVTAFIRSSDDPAAVIDDLEQLVASLRPADAASWRAMLGAVPTTDPDLLAADTLADLAALPDGG